MQTHLKGTCTKTKQLALSYSHCSVIKQAAGFFLILYFQLDTLLFCLHTITVVFFPLHVSGLTGPSSGVLNCTSSLWYSPPLRMSLSCGRWERTVIFAGFFSATKPAKTTVLSQRPHDKDICRGGEYHRLLVQFRTPDDGPVRPETCRGKKTTVIVRKQKSSVSSWK